MATGHGTCEEALAAAQATLERLQSQYATMDAEYQALTREWWELSGRPSAGRSIATADAPAVAQLAQVVQQLEGGGGGGGEATTESRPVGTDPVAMLMRRAAGIRERIDRLEAET